MGRASVERNVNKVVVAAAALRCSDPAVAPWKFVRLILLAALASLMTRLR